MGKRKNKHTVFLIRKQVQMWDSFYIIRPNQAEIKILFFRTSSLQYFNFNLESSQYNWLISGKYQSVTTRLWSFWCAFQANSFRPMNCVNGQSLPTLRWMDQCPSKTGYWQGTKFGHFYPNTGVRITLSSLTVAHISQLHWLSWERWIPLCNSEK